MNNRKINDILTENGIRGYKLVLKVILAALNKPYLSVEVGNIIQIAVAREKIKAGELVSAYVGALIEYAMVLTNLRETQEASKVYQKVIDGFSDPEILKVAWNNKGLVLATLGNYEEAIICYEKALEFDPTQKESHYNKGRALSFLGRFPEAIESYEKAIEFDENYEDAKKYLAEAKEKNLQ